MTKKSSPAEEFRCRFVIPRQSPWHEVTATSWQQAANDFHEAYVELDGGLRFVHEREGGKREVISFAVVDVAECGQVFSRVYLQGITRKGGVLSAAPDTIEDVARRLGWARPLQELLTPWQGEETWDDAMMRRWGRRA